MKISTTFAALSLFGAFAMSPAFAADASPARQGGPAVDACRQDVETLCPGVQPGDGRVKTCLRKNRSKVSDGCKVALKEARAEKKAAAGK